MAENTRTASQDIRRAVVAKGYLNQAHFYTQPRSDEIRTLTYYRHRIRHENWLLLEVITDSHSLEEIHCELWRPVSLSGSVDDTIDAIP